MILKQIGIRKYSFKIILNIININCLHLPLFQESTSSEENIIEALNMHKSTIFQRLILNNIM